MEAGRRFAEESFPATSWDVKRFLWAPRLGCYGIQRIHALPDVMVLAGAGVGGGSLVYANTLYVPPKAFFEAGQWAHITDWAERAMAMWPNKGDADPRPPLGSAYRRVGPVAPVRPGVPQEAPGALRLPIADIRSPDTTLAPPCG